MCDLESGGITASGGEPVACAGAGHYFDPNLSRFGIGGTYGDNLKKPATNPDMIRDSKEVVRADELSEFVKREIDSSRSDKLPMPKAHSRTPGEVAEWPNAAVC